MNERVSQEVLRLADRTLWIVTASDGTAKGGLVATFVNSASLVPSLPRLLIGLAPHHRTWQLIRHSRSFAAHLVTEDRCDLIWRFGLASGRTSDKFSGIDWKYGQTGSPLIEAALGWLECSVEEEFDIGDRTIFVGAAIDAAIQGSGTPLTASRMVALATAEQRERLRVDRDDDAALDAAAIVEWRNMRH